MVFYRKYRPQTIEELDNEQLRELLYAFFSRNLSREAGKIPQAFLFTGPKGLGKTSTARIVAKVINCERIASSKLASSSNPCNKCSQCISITNGTNLDILEIDGASNRGIDEIRDLREKVRLSPVSAQKKVYIIDEVHMLTAEAFNALLKTLEEPPMHVVFILCTTEEHKVPATIISRCQHIAFPLASDQDLVRSFKRIVKGEKLNVEDGILESVAKLSDGSFRDGAKILEELVALSNGKKIRKELLEKKYKVSSINYSVEAMFGFLVERDVKNSLQLIKKLAEAGTDTKHFLEALIERVHTDLLVKAGLPAGPLRPASPNRGEREASKAGVEAKAKDSPLDINDLKTLIELLAKAHTDIKYAVLPSLPLEIAIIEWGMSPTGSAEVAHENFRVHDAKEGKGSTRTSKPASAHSENFVGSSRLPTSVIPRLPIKDNLLEELITKIKPHNHSIAGVLRGCTLKTYNGKEMVIETKYKFHKERLEEAKAHSIIEKVCREIAGAPVKISVLLTEKMS
ncbi:MAG: DNA polymerase III subunit gamma/tau [bacterium]|nr:DNA polymerase III subunit gamma/tau [bacterium]